MGQKPSHPVEVLRGMPQKPIPMMRIDSQGSLLTVDSDDTAPRLSELSAAGVAKVKTPGSPPRATAQASQPTQPAVRRGSKDTDRPSSKDALPPIPPRTARRPSKEAYVEKNKDELEFHRMVRAASKTGIPLLDDFIVSAEDLDEMLRASKPAWKNHDARDGFREHLHDMRVFYNWDEIPLDFFVDGFVGGVSKDIKTMVRSGRSRAADGGSGAAAAGTTGKATPSARRRGQSETEPPRMVMAQGEMHGTKQGGCFEC